MVGVIILLIGMTSYVYGTPPIFENNTPVGFSPEDSTSQEDFVLGQRVDVRVDLNQAATPTYPVSGHFHNIERSKQVNSTDVDGLRADIAVSTDGTIHMAWISEEMVTPVSTPIYQVLYARSDNSGVSFSDPQSVSGSLRFDVLTLSLGGTNAFSTLDIEVDSRGNPRVVYAFDFSPDGRTAQFNNTNPDNVFFNYSETSGASWLPGNTAVVVNDTTTVGNTEGRDTAFPRMAIDQRDNIFITYVRGVTSAGTNRRCHGCPRSTVPRRRSASRRWISRDLGQYRGSENLTRWSNSRDRSGHCNWHSRRPARDLLQRHRRRYRTQNPPGR